MKLLLKIPSRASRIIERGLLLTGVVALVVFAVAHAHRAIMVRAEMERFKEAKRSAEITNVRNAQVSTAPNAVLPGDRGSAPSLENGGLPAARGSAKHGFLEHVDFPLAVLRIPRLRLEVPVLNGTDELTLNRGVGRIAGTASIGQRGNIGIAGHRDGFFSGLKDIQRGDQIELLTANSTDVYIVDRILITGPDDVSVLQSRAEPSLTLVTCYPFHFIGPAPRRFIVGASLKERE